MFSRKRKERTDGSDDRSALNKVKKRLDRLEPRVALLETQLKVVRRQT